MKDLTDLAAALHLWTCVRDHPGEDGDWFCRRIAVDLDAQGYVAGVRVAPSPETPGRTAIIDEYEAAAEEWRQARGEAARNAAKVRWDAAKRAMDTLSAPSPETPGLRGALRLIDYELRNTDDWADYVDITVPLSRMRVIRRTVAALAATPAPETPGLRTAIENLPRWTKGMEAVGGEWVRLDAVRALAATSGESSDG